MSGIAAPPRIASAACPACAARRSRRQTGGDATNFYVWENEAAARAFFTDDLRERVTGLYGVPPSIRYVEIAELVDNAS